MSNLFDPKSSEPPATYERSPTPNDLMGSAQLHSPLNPSQMSVLLQRNARQFAEACRNLAVYTQSAVDPLDGVRSAMQRLLDGETSHRVRFSHFADHEDGNHVAIRCRAIVLDIKNAIHPFSDSPDDISESEAFDRAISPFSVTPVGLRAAGKRVGYRVDISLLATALAGLDTVIDEVGPDAFIRSMPMGIRHITTGCLLTFRPHLCAENLGKHLVVRFLPRDLEDYADAGSKWIVIGNAQIDPAASHPQ